MINIFHGHRLYLCFAAFRFWSNFCTIPLSLFYDFKSSIKEGSFIYLRAHKFAMIGI